MASSRKSFNALAKALGIVTSKSISRPGNKFGARKTVVDGITFDSVKEGQYYRTLKEQKRLGIILDFEIKRRWDLVVKGNKVTRYTCDFVVFNRDGSETVIDVKGGNATRTRDYVLRKKLMKAIHGIDIVEV